MNACEMTVGDNGKNCSGIENYWKCGKPAKFVLKKPGTKDFILCGLHGKTLINRREKSRRLYGATLPGKIIEL